MVLALGLNGEGAVSSRAQEPTPASKPKLAYVRFWNMLPGKANDILELLSGENKPLTTAVPSNYYAGYVPVTPGTYTFIVRRPTDVANPIKRLPVNLPGDAYITILASAKDGPPTVEAINDTIDPKTAIVGRLVLRQYVAGARVTAAVGTGVSASALGYGESAVLDNLPAAQVIVNVQATFASGPAKSWAVPVDFTTDHHSTLLIVADPYGHFRPRLTADGHAIIEPPPSAPH